MATRSAKQHYFEVIPLLKLPRTIAQHYTYEHSGVLSKGQLVLITFKSKRVEGMVILESEKPSFATKKIVSVLPYSVSATQLFLFEHLQVYYGASKTMALRTIVPQLLRAKKVAPENTKSKSNLSVKLKANEMRVAATLQAQQTIVYQGLPVLDAALLETISKQSAQTLIVAPDHHTLRVCSQLLADVGLNYLAWGAKNTSESTINWSRVAGGEKIILGTRSALFAPFQKLQCIVVLDPAAPGHASFEMQPRYHAAPVSRALGEEVGAQLIVVEGSPSVTYGYGLRALLASPVKPTLINRHAYGAQDRRAVISSDVASIIDRTAGRTFLFVNKLGSSTFMCAECEYIPRCSVCDKPLFYSTATRELGQLQCFTCTTQAEGLVACPVCSASELHVVGIGVERVQREVERLYPQRTVHVHSADRIPDYDSHNNDIIVVTAAIRSHLSVLGKNDAVVVLRSDQLLSAHSGWGASEDFFTLMQLFLLSRAAVSVEVSDQDSSVARLLELDALEVARKIAVERNKYGYPPYRRLIAVTVSRKNDRLVKVMKKHDKNVLVVPVARGVKYIARISPDANFKPVWKVLPADAVVDVDPVSLL